MEKTMMCYICNQVTTTTCKLCGKPVCQNHVDARGICNVCTVGRVIE